MITGGWALALRDTGNFTAARKRHLDAAQAETQAGGPSIAVIGSELEALRTDIIQGQVDNALPQVQQRLAQVEAWWQRCRAGAHVPEAPDIEQLARVYICALDIANEAHRAKNDWSAALRRTESMLEVLRALGRAAEEIARHRMNRAVELGRLQLFPEAQAELEDCLAVFRNDPLMRSKVLSSLASLFNQQGDYAQAIAQERRALALHEQFPDPVARAISQNNLGDYLRSHQTSVDLAEAPKRDLAALSYNLVAEVGVGLQISINNYGAEFQRAHATGTELIVPRVAQLLADPAFEPLAQWLRERQVDVDELQSAVDQFLEKAKQIVLTRE